MTIASASAILRAPAGRRDATLVVAVDTIVEALVEIEPYVLREGDLFRFGYRVGVASAPTFDGSDVDERTARRLAGESVARAKFLRFVDDYVRDRVDLARSRVAELDAADEALRAILARDEIRVPELVSAGSRAKEARTAFDGDPIARALYRSDAARAARVARYRARFGSRDRIELERAFYDYVDSLGIEPFSDAAIDSFRVVEEGSPR